MVSLYTSFRLLFKKDIVATAFAMPPVTFPGFIVHRYDFSPAGACASFVFQPGTLYWASVPLVIQQLGEKKFVSDFV